MLLKRGTKSPRLVDKDSVCDNDSTVVIISREGTKSPKVLSNSKIVLMGCNYDNDIGENPLNVVLNVWKISVVIMIKIDGKIPSKVHQMNLLIMINLQF